MVVVMVGLLDFVLGWVGGGCSSPLSLSLSLSLSIYIYIYILLWLFSPWLWCLVGVWSI